MNDNQKAELRRLAEAATPGPWSKKATGVYADCGSIFNNYGKSNGKENRAYVAAAHPTAVLSLLDENVQLRAEVEALRRDAGRYQWLCEHFGVTKLPCAVERILAGDIYVADGKAGVDVAIDAAISKEPSTK